MLISAISFSLFSSPAWAKESDKAQQEALYNKAFQLVLFGSGMIIVILWLFGVTHLFFKDQNSLEYREANKNFNIFALVLVAPLLGAVVVRLFL
ncbi:hypothetical protein [Gloeothece citriformis]|uniref:hypothetical protein n=1 Tax=Gloeothece citriformis TaxID=2546356 RepID=UPI00059D8066|nr:hypothetical protein [Gloeothece citriformis]